MVITNNNGTPVVSYGIDETTLYGAPTGLTKTNDEVTFGKGTLAQALGRIGGTADGLIAFGNDGDKGAVVVNGKLASSKILDVSYIAPVLYDTDDEYPGKKAGDLKEDAKLKISYIDITGTDAKVIDSEIIIPSEKSTDELKARVKALEDFNTVADSSDDKINTVKDILDWFDTVSEKGTSSYEVTVDGETVALGIGQAGLLQTVAKNKLAIGTKNTAAANEKSNATGLYKEIEDAINDASKSVTIATDSTDFLAVTEGTDHEISAKTVALVDALGMTKDADGKWVAGSDADQVNGLATAADVAAEIVSDEIVIAAALNDHEARIIDLSSNLTSLSIGTNADI